MYYSKEGTEYKDDINKLFMKSFASENDHLQNANRASAMFHSFNRSPSVNRSSSSGDSISPEFYPDFPSFLPRQERNFQEMPGCSTPLLRRPIVGRKILGQNEPLMPVSDILQMPHQNAMYSDQVPVYPNRQTEDPFLLWQSEDSFSKTPPSNTTENKTPFYELFPSENRRFDFRTPVHSSTSAKLPANISPGSSSYSLKSGLSSPNYAQNLANCSFGTPPSPSQPSFHKPRFELPMSPSRPQSRCTFDSEVGSAKLCTFCRKNGETPMVYTTHRVKEQMNGNVVVTCPILRSHVCATCGGTGDNAHTITYCPVLRNSNYGLRIPSTTITLKNTRVKSNGKRRF